MKVSIIQNCLNGEKYLEKSLNSINDQTYQNYELIFLDNCSNDRSKEILEKFKNSKFKYYKTEKKLKLYEARNLAISKSNGEYIAFLDVDDWWEPSKLFEQVQVLNKNIEVDVVYSNYYIFNENSKLKKKNSQKKLPSGFILNDLIKEYKIGILTTILRSEIFFKQNIWFDPSFTILGDYDFFLRIAKNKNFFYINKCLANYRNHNSNYSILNFTEELKEFEYFSNKPEIKNLISIDQISDLQKYYTDNKERLLKLENINRNINNLSSKPISINKVLKLIYYNFKKKISRIL